MKKILVAALIGSMVLSLTACGGETKESTENAITGESISSEAASTDASSAENTESSEDAASVEDSSSSEDAGEEVIAPDFSGTYTEPLSGRCTIDITSTGNNTYTVNVHWSSSAFESSTGKSMPPIMTPRRFWSTRMQSIISAPIPLRMSIRMT